MAKFTTVLIPTDHNFIPTPEAVAAAISLMEKYFPDRGEEVQSRTWDQPAFIDSGDALETLSCPACGNTVERFEEEGEAWWDQVMQQLWTSENPMALEMTMPCCSQTVLAKDIRFDGDAGFARFKLYLPDPGDSVEPTPKQLAKLEVTLGCKLICFVDVWS